MNSKLILLCAVFFIEVQAECGDYLSCLSDLIHGFFGTKPKNSTADNNFNNKTDLYEIKDFSNKDLDRILTQVSSIVKDNVTGDIIESRSNTAEFMNNNTKVLVKVFDFDKPKALSDKKDEVAIFVTLPSSAATEITTEKATKSATEITIRRTTESSIKSGTERTTESATTSTNEKPTIFTTENVQELSLTTDIIHQVNNMAVSFDNLEDNLILSENSYLDPENNNTDYPNIDYIEIYKDATIEYMDFVPTQPIIVSDENVDDIDNQIEYSATEEKSTNTLVGHESGISEAVFPWIATIFVKNDSKDNQFEYYCDGAILNNRFILTAARCVNINNVTMKADYLLIVLGKKSLHSVGQDEKVHKVKDIKIHENYTVEGGGARNDLAVLELDEPAILNGVIQSAVLAEEEFGVDDSATTAWGFTGDLTPILFDKEASRKCNLQAATENTFCATYGNDIALCPSYGGLHIIKHTDKWYLRGIRTGDPERRGICIIRDVSYTDVEKYRDWIDGVVANIVL